MTDTETYTDSDGVELAEGDRVHTVGDLDPMDHDEGVVQAIDPDACSGLMIGWDSGVAIPLASGDGLRRGDRPAAEAEDLLQRRLAASA